MLKRLLLLAVSAITIISPLAALGQSSSNVFTEEFKSLAKITAKNTYAVVNTAAQSVTLPRRSGFTNHAQGLEAFKRASITAIAHDGAGVMIGGSNGAIALIGQTSSAEDLTGLLAGKSKRINAIGFAEEAGFWLIGGEATRRGDGALLAKLVPGGLKTEDLQALAKEIGMDAVTDISCMKDGCLLSGTPRKLAFYDGSVLLDLSAAEGFTASDPIRVASNGVVWFVAATARTIDANKKTIYPVVGYLYDGKSLRSVNIPASRTGTSAGSVDIAWNGESWLLVQGKPVFAAWTVSGEPVTEITDVFDGIFEKKSIDPIVGSYQKQWLVSGKQWKGLLALSGDAAEDVALQIPDISGAIFASVENGPWEKTLLGGNVGGEAMLVGVEFNGYLGSAAIESAKVATVSGKNITKATLSYEGATPPGTGIEFLIGTAENRWETAEPDREKIVTTPGSALYWRAVLYSENPSATPTLRKVSINYSTETPDTIAKIRSRDSRRVSDIGKVNSAIKKFETKRGSFPVVDGASASDRWQQLGRLLSDGDFLSALPDDPQHPADTERQYDYLSRTDGSYYILRATLEETANKSLTKDIDGVPFPFSQAFYTCDDPVYCMGATPVSTAPPAAPSASAPPASPPPADISSRPAGLTLIKDASGKIWRIINGKRLYWPSPSLLASFRASPSRTVSIREIERYPRVRLLKSSVGPEIFVITDANQKRHIPTWQAFTDYGFTLRDVVNVTLEEILAIGDNTLIKLDKDPRVWKIEGASRRLIPNPEIFNARRWRWTDIATVNPAEFQVYTEGSPLQ